jgi:broad specificity phosphatase PhoE
MGISYGDGRWFDNEFEQIADSHQSSLEQTFGKGTYDSKSDTYKIDEEKGSQNFEDAKKDLNLNSQEEALYQRHLQNLRGSGGVDNPDGSRSSLFNKSFDHEGKTYNLPSVKEGKILSDDDTWSNAVQEGLSKFPSYGSQEEAQSRYGKMHDYMEKDTAEFQNKPQSSLTEPKDIHIIRHGTTEENEEDKIRGTNDDVKLSDEGRKHALEASKELRSKGIEALVSSPLARAKETSQIIGKELGIPITVNDKLKTWNVGNFEGKPCEGNNDTLQDYAENKPDEKVPGGESYNEFKDRAFEGIRESILANKDKKLGIVTHHMVESSLEGWEKTGQDNPSLDLSKLFEDTDQPGSVRKMTMEPDSTIMQPDWDPFEKAATRVREAVKPGVTGHLSYTERTGHDISNYRGSRHEGMATRAGEAIATSPLRTIGEPLLRGAQNLMEALKMISNRGHEGSLTDEEIETIAPKLFDFTSMLNTPARPIPNTLGMFVAPSLGKKLYAQGLLKQGLSPGEVKALTGVEKGAEGKLRQEVSDLGSYVINDAEAILNSVGSTKLGHIFDHPDLYSVYPEARDIYVKYNPKLPKTTDARFTGDIELNPALKDPMDIHDAILHELQHWVQYREGFAFNVPSDAPESFVKQFGARMRKEGVTESPKERIYRQLASEVEARNTQKRVGMTDLERRISLASETEDIQRSHQLIFDEKGNRIDASMAKEYSLTKDIPDEQVKFRLGQMLRDKASTKKTGYDVESSDYMYYNTRIRELRERLKDQDRSPNMSKPPSKVFGLPSEVYEQRVKDVLTKQPELRQIPFGVDPEYVRSLSYEDYVKMLDYSEEAYAKLLKEHPEKSRNPEMSSPSGKLLQGRYLEGIQKQLNAGKSFSEIGKSLKVSKDTIAGLVKRNNLKSARPPDKAKTGVNRTPLLDPDFDL